MRKDAQQNTYLLAKCYKDRQVRLPGMKAAKRVGSLPSSLFRAAFSISQRPRGTCIGEEQPNTMFPGNLQGYMLCWLLPHSEMA